MLASKTTLRHSLRHGLNFRLFSAARACVRTHLQHCIAVGDSKAVAGALSSERRRCRRVPNSPLKADTILLRPFYRSNPPICCCSLFEEALFLTTAFPPRGGDSFEPNNNPSSPLADEAKTIFDAFGGAHGCWGAHLCIPRRLTSPVNNTPLALSVLGATRSHFPCNHCALSDSCLNLDTKRRQGSPQVYKTPVNQRVSQEYTDTDVRLQIQVRFGGFNGRRGGGSSGVRAPGMRQDSGARYGTDCTAPAHRKQSVSPGRAERGAIVCVLLTQGHKPANALL